MQTEDAVSLCIPSVWIGSSQYILRFSSDCILIALFPGLSGFLHFTALAAVTPDSPTVDIRQFSFVVSQFKSVSYCTALLHAKSHNHGKDWQVNMKCTEVFHRSQQEL